MRARIYVSFLLLLTGVACATPARQTEALLAAPPVAQSEKRIENVPFIEQSAGHCGPATLAMAMNWAGKNITVDELAPQVFTPGMKGSFQLDMVTASRRNGFMAVPIQGMSSLVREVEAGHPVVVFENLALTWLPQWHYALVFGYDLPQQKIILHSGPEAAKRWDLSKFERSWMLGDYWGLVVLPAGQLAASAGELPHVRAASALEQLGKTNEAALSYQAILQKWPKSLGPRIGLANLAFAQKNFEEAERLLLQATADHPDAAMAWFNLSVAQNASKKTKQATKSRERALALATPEQRSLMEKNF